ncbi:hypothetical protein SAMN05444166_6097 [Singulisphaera sp. GP187]|nr:hypothetical protein SAMN05444166_6097 [Singulisphaera sp. GP187]
MEKDVAGCPSLLSHYGLTNPGTSRTSPAAYPTPVRFDERGVETGRSATAPLLDSIYMICFMSHDSHARARASDSRIARRSCVRVSFARLSPVANYKCVCT